MVTGGRRREEENSANAGHTWNTDLVSLPYPSPSFYKLTFPCRRKRAKSL